MIIVSIKEPTYSRIHKKIQTVSKYAHLIEVRLDALKTFDIAKTKELHQLYAPLFTFRSFHEGGANYSLKQRSEILTQLISIQPKYLDLELKRDFVHIEDLKKRSPRTKWICSFHSFHSMPKRLLEIISQMKSLNPWRCKLACLPSSFLGVLKLLLLMKQDPKVVAIAMGKLGQCTRIMGPLYGQKITYASVNEIEGESLGQLSARALCEFYRYPELSKKTKLLGLIGDPVDQSPGVSVYNSLFKKLKIDALYLNFPLKKKDFFEGADLLRQLNLYGASVTTPHKFSAGKWTASFKENKIPINTLRFTHKQVHTTNTDMKAVECLLGSYRKQKVWIVGAGGTAFASALAFKKKNHLITICNRNLSKAKRLAQIIDGNACSLQSLSQLKKEQYDILIQTTNVGDETTSLIEKKVLYSGKKVLDVVLKKTLLIKHAKAKGCCVFMGYDFWIKQGLEQLKFWFKKLPDQLEEKMRQSLNEYLDS